MQLTADLCEQEQAFSVVERLEVSPADSDRERPVVGLEDTRVERHAARVERYFTRHVVVTSNIAPRNLDAGPDGVS